MSYGMMQRKEEWGTQEAQAGTGLRIETGESALGG